MDKEQEEYFNDLYGAWEINGWGDEYDIGKEYVSNKDSEALKERVKLSHFFQTHVIPLPFWGNIINPKYIVLSLNPSCEPVVDELESEIFYDELKNTLLNKDNKIDWLDKKFDLEKEISEDEQKCLDDLSNYKTTHRWWKEVFGEKFKNKNFDNVGFFNLYGYHSRTFNNIPKKFLKNPKELLPTTKAIVNYVKYLIEKKGVKIILLWGTEWKKYLNLDTDNDKLLIVNKDIPFNKRITKDIYEKHSDFFYDLT